MHGGGSNHKHQVLGKLSNDLTSMWGVGGEEKAVCKSAIAIQHPGKWWRGMPVGSLLLLNVQNMQSGHLFIR